MNENLDFDTGTVEKHKKAKKAGGSRHRFNALDAVLILMAIAAAGLLIAVYSPSALFGNTGKTARITYTVELTAVDPGLAAAVRVGDEVTDGNGYAIGQVAAEVEVAPYQIVSYSADGDEVILAEHPTLSNLLITISAEAADNGESGYTVNGRRIAIGAGYTLVLPGFEGSGNCIGIIIDQSTDGGTAR